MYERNTEPAAPASPAVDRPIRSLIAQPQKQALEIPDFSCVDPVETAADKLSALAWRVCTRVRGAAKDDPTIVRHLHDLAALESLAIAFSAFASLLSDAAMADTGRGGEGAPADIDERLALMFESLAGDFLVGG